MAIKFFGSNSLTQLITLIKNKFDALATVAKTGSYNDLNDLPPAAAVNGVKGDAESTYRTGNVNLTAANVGAMPDATVPINKGGTGGITYASAIENLFDGDSRYRMKYVDQDDHIGNITAPYEGLAIWQANDESSGILLTGDGIYIFAPPDETALSFINEDDDAIAWSIDGDGEFSGHSRLDVRALPNMTQTLDSISEKGNCMGMVYASDGPDGANWYHFVNMSYNFESNNRWQCQLICKAGSTNMRFRSRSGGGSVSSGWTGWQLLSLSGHTHNYAGSSSAGGDATRALKLKDYTNNNDTYLDYGSSAITSFTYFAVWDGYRLRACNKANVVSIIGAATSGHNHSGTYAPAAWTYRGSKANATMTIGQSGVNEVLIVVTTGVPTMTFTLPADAIKNRVRGNPLIFGASNAPCVYIDTYGSNFTFEVRNGYNAYFYTR